MKLFLILASSLVLASGQEYGQSQKQQNPSGNTGSKSPTSFFTTVLSGLNTGINDYLSSPDFQDLRKSAEPKKPPYSGPIKFQPINLKGLPVIESIPFARKLQDAFFQKAIQPSFQFKTTKAPTPERAPLAPYAPNPHQYKGTFLKEGSIIPSRGIRVTLPPLQHSNSPFSATIREAPVSQQQIHQSLNNKNNFNNNNNAGAIIKAQPFQLTRNLGYSNNQNVNDFRASSAPAFRTRIVEAYNKSPISSSVVQGFEISNAINLIEERKPETYAQIQNFGDYEVRVQDQSQSQRAETYGAPPAGNSFRPLVSKSYFAPSGTSSYSAPSAQSGSESYGVPSATVFNDAPSVETVGQPYGTPADVPILKTNDVPVGQSYGAPAAVEASQSYGAPSSQSASQSYGAPSSQSASQSYGAPSSQSASQSYGAPSSQSASQSYGAPSSQSASQSYGAPSSQSASQSYGAPSSQSASQSYGAPSSQSASQSYGAPSSQSASQSYGAPSSQSASQSYGAPSSQSASQSYGAPSSQSASQSYGAPSSQSASQSYGAPSSQSASQSYGAPSSQSASQSYGAPSSQSASQSYGAPSANVFNDAPSVQTIGQAYGSPSDVPAAQAYITPAGQSYGAPESSLPDPTSFRLDGGNSGYSSGQESGAADNVNHIFVHAAPQSAPDAPAPYQAQAEPEVHQQIIFVKAPAPAQQGQTFVELPPQPETRTKVYVLVKEPERGEDSIRVVAPAPTTPSPPEVFFVRYANKGGDGGGGASGFTSAGGSQQTDLLAPQTTLSGY